MKILYCTDFSDSALYSFEKALPFLKPDCEAHVISVIESGYEHIKTYKENKLKNLEKLKLHLQSQGLKVTQTLSPIGDPGESVLKQAKQEQYDLILVGSHKKLIEKWIGSVSRKIVTHSNVPVFVARKPSVVIPSERKKEVLFAVDGSENSFNAMTKALEILDFQDSSLEILYVKPGVENLPVEIIYDTDWLERIIEMQNENAIEVIENASNIVNQSGVKVDARLTLEGDSAGQIMKYAETQEKDIIIMGSHGRTGVSSLLLGSISKRVLDNTTCPVLIVPSNKI